MHQKGTILVIYHQDCWQEFILEFRINKPANKPDSTRYDWVIYVDNNADGRYSPGGDVEIWVKCPSFNRYFSNTKPAKRDYADVIPWVLILKAGRYYDQG